MYALSAPRTLKDYEKPQIWIFDVAFTDFLKTSDFHPEGRLSREDGGECFAPQNPLRGHVAHLGDLRPRSRQPFMKNVDSPWSEWNVRSRCVQLILAMPSKLSPLNSYSTALRGVRTLNESVYVFSSFRVNCFPESMQLQKVSQMQM